MIARHTLALLPKDTARKIARESLGGLHARG
jgi:hypothetical protein